MRDFNDLIKLIKRIAVEAVEASKPTNVVFGQVTSASPLKITIEQKITLSSQQLILTRNVTDHEIEMTLDHETDYKSGGSGDSSFASHNHAVTGKKTMTLHNALKKGEKVALLRTQGGQQYVVIDRVVT
jgi:hypothetical protein